jgi:UDP-2-acetamido-2-deoxy-ribo-hexuluronate aminotransferase
VHYPVPIHLQPAYAHVSGDAACPVAHALADTVMSLPMGPYLPDEDIRRVCAVLLDAVGTSAQGPSVLDAPATGASVAVSV